MAEFQTILGIILIIVSVVLIALSIYQLSVIGKSRTNLQDAKSTLSDGEKRAAIVIGVIEIVIAIILGVYGVVLVLPEKNTPKAISSLRGPRSISESMLSPEDI